MSVETEKKAFDESTAKITEQKEKNLTEIFVSVFFFIESICKKNIKNICIKLESRTGSKRTD